MNINQHLSRRTFMTRCGAAVTSGPVILAAVNHPASIQLLHTPAGGLQPQSAVDRRGILHLVYLIGEPANADVFYVRKFPDKEQFSPPMRVNREPGSAIALGTVRGAHLALGHNDRVHVAWNGSSTAKFKAPRNSAPMLYSRLNDTGSEFEPERNLMQASSALDGGGTVAADQKGNVYVTWHGQSLDQPAGGEERRRVWIARSSDNGRSFSRDFPASPAELGACGCCGMGALATSHGKLYLLFRAARQIVHRDMYLLISEDFGKTFRTIDVHPWEIGACPMSTVSLAEAPSGRVLLSWETGKQIFFASLDAHTDKFGAFISPPGAAINRKHPSIAVSDRGETLLVWAEGTSWKKGGFLAWQCFDSRNQPLSGNSQGSAIPAWDFATAAAFDNKFLVIS